MLFVKSNVIAQIYFHLKSFFLVSIQQIQFNDRLEGKAIHKCPSGVTNQREDMIL